MNNCDDNENEHLSLPKKFCSTVFNWAGVVFGLLMGIIQIVLTLINNSLKELPEKSILVIPFWVWIIVALAFVLLGVVIIIVINASFKHHFFCHNSSTQCDSRITSICDRCESIQSTRENECKGCVEKMNSKIEQQQDYLLKVDSLVANAQKLEKLYAEAVAERLRTNKQVADIESKVKSNTEIYIMTSHFLLERYDSDMRNSIVKNINKGVKYRYIIPEGTDNDFAQMVYAILADKSLKQSYRNMKTNDFFTATRLKKEYFMLTIAYYEINSESLSEVIVKLPADTLDEVTQDKALTYLVPKGLLTTYGNKKYNSEHKLFLDNLSALYNIGRKENGGEIKLTAKRLKQNFPDGVDIAPNHVVHLD